MSSDPLPQWLDEQQPHEPEASATQIDALLAALRKMAATRRRPLKVLELGCGAGRVLRPLAGEGYEIVGIDNNADALAACGEGLSRDGRSAALLEQDFIAQPWPDERFDAILCLGNTFMTIADLDVALALLTKAAGSLAPNGVLMLDDLPGDFWPELTEGNWQAGISEEGSSQLVWDARDSVFALRSGDAVDVESWTFKAEDRRLRLWTSGSLSLACQVAGLSEPAVHPGLLVMKRRGDEAAA